MLSVHCTSDQQQPPSAPHVCGSPMSLRSIHSDTWAGLLVGIPLLQFSWVARHQGNPAHAMRKSIGKGDICCSYSAPC